LRVLLIHGARAVVRVAHKYQDRKSRWIGELGRRRGKNVTAVAVANKNARIAWAILSKRVTYQVAAA
jgi:transposase